MSRKWQCCDWKPGQIPSISLIGFARDNVCQESGLIGNLITTIKVYFRARIPLRKLSLMDKSLQAQSSRIKMYGLASIGMVQICSSTPFCLPICAALLEALM